MKSITVTLATLVLGLTAGAASAGDGEGDRERRHSMSHPGGPSMMHGMGDPQRMVERMSHWLELDETQQQDLANVWLAAEPQFKSLRNRLRTNRESIAGLKVGNVNYEQDVHTLATENGQLATEMTLLAAQLRADIYARLTPEQQLKFAEGAGKMRHHSRERHHPGEGDTEL